MTGISDFVQQSHNFIAILSRCGKAGAGVGRILLLADGW
jgi:hypothetical protein